MPFLGAHVAHELSTPLTNLGLLVASARRLTNDPDVLDKLDRIDEVRKQLAAVITEVLAVGTPRRLAVEPTDLCTVAHAALVQAEPFRMRDVEADLQVGLAPVLAEVDPIQIQLVLTDLLKNAYQATERGAVTLSVQEDGSRVRLAVTDTGCGMSPDVQRNIFSAFFTTSVPGQGAGLGLAFCRNVVSSHRGKIIVWSRPGHGSTFTVVLPRKASDAHPGRRRR